MISAIDNEARLAMHRRFVPRFLIMSVALAALLMGGEVAIDSIYSPTTGWLALTLGLLLAVAMVFGYRFLVRWLERRSPSELSFDGALSNVGLGCIVGLSLFGIVYLTLWGMGVLTIDSVGDFSRFLTALTMAIVSAVGEEILMRGMVFRLVEEKIGTFGALAFSAIVFGGVHLANPGASLASALSVALEAGILLGLAFALARNLWFPIGIHFGWNLAEGGIFGAAVSGLKSHGVVHATLSGPDLLTGGQFGPEQSIVTVVACVVVSLFFLSLAATWRRLA